MNTKRIVTILIAFGLITALTVTAYAASGELSGLGRNSKTIVGTWLVDVAQSDSGLPPFKAFHTFDSGGNFIETSDLQGFGEEGPAHGVWEGRGQDYTLTFHVFTFDKTTGANTGKVVVRVALQFSDRDHMTGHYAVDFVEPSGNVIPNIDTGSYTGVRMQVEAAP